MPRSKIVTINGKQINIKEYKIRELREDVLPKITDLLGGEKLVDKELPDLVPLLESKLVELFPGLTEADIEEAYFSEIEALIEAWVDVNFIGLKKVYRPLLSFAQMGLAR